MAMVIDFLIAAMVGFAAGYGLRAYISHRRRYRYV
jgi:hypothetical protein